MTTKVIMPQLGESVVEGTVSKWLKQVGERIDAYEPLLEISTDKVDTEVPSPASGVILQIYVAAGQTVERGVLLALIGEPGEAVPEASPAKGNAIPAAVGAGERSSDQDQGAHNHENGKSSGPRISPVVARMASENRLDLSQIAGSGLGGRVTKKDVEKYLETRATQPTSAAKSAEPANAGEVPPWEQPGDGDLFRSTDELFNKTAAPLVPPKTPPVAPSSVVPSPVSPAIPGDLIPLTAMRRAIADHMVRSEHTAPHVTTIFEVDMSRVMAHWKANIEPYAKQGVKLTLTAYFVSAIVQAAQAQPTLNSRWMDDGLFVYKAVNVGMAVAIPDGLIVPVIRNAQDLNLSGIARQVVDLADRARRKALRLDDTAGGTITLSNHGVSGSLLATPIINQPQSAIIGTGAIKKRVIVLDDADAIAIRPMMYVSLTFDHRVTDGAAADGFLATFTRTLEGWG